MTVLPSVLIVGAGNIGATIARLLVGCGDYKVTIADASEHSLTAFADLDVETVPCDITEPNQARAALQGRDIVINACPFYLSKPIAEAAAELGVHYFDLTEDVSSTREIQLLAKNSRSAFMPQCGLAPGFIGIAAYDLSQRFDTLERVQMRVGALPQFPTNSLMYNLTWSTEGLINEYCNPCEAIHDGERRELLPLEGKEKFSLDGINYEAFNTSGGLGTLCETLAGKVQYLDYKTVRYQGHCTIMRVLINELRLSKRRRLFRELLEASVPVTLQDVVLIFITVSGQRDGKLTQESFAKKIYDQTIDGHHMSAIQVTTAASVCAVVDLHTEGKLPASGFIRQEDVNLDAFMNNRFGKYYA